jgi:hypothetical protein
MVKKTAVKPRAKAKKAVSPKIQKVPTEYVFWVHDGGIYTDLMELAEGLKLMSDETYCYHANQEKHDFANWVRNVICDEYLADELLVAADRMEAANCVMTRINYL